MKVFKAFFTLSFLSVIARALSFFRDILFASLLGASAYSDAFFVVLRFCSTLKSFFADGPLSAVFVPAYLKKNTQEKSEFSSNIFSFLLCAIIIFITVLWLAAPLIIRFIAPGFAGLSDKLTFATGLFRIMLPVIILLCISAFSAALLQAGGRPWGMAILSTVFNFFLICTIGFIYKIDANAQNAARFLGYGVLLAGAMQATILFFLVRKFIGLKLGKNFWQPENRREFFGLLRRFVPTVLSGCADRTNAFVNMFFASKVTGLNSYLYYADKIVHIPIYIIGFSMNCVMLPEISEKIAAGRDDEVNFLQSRIVEFILVLCAPLTIIISLFSDEIAVNLLHRGNFSFDNALQTAQVLQIFAFALPAMILAQIIASNFFARQDTKTPMQISLCCLAINVLANWICSRFFGRVEVVIINTAVMWLDCALLFVVLRKKKFFLADARLSDNINKIILAAFLMLGSIVVLSNVFEFFNWNLNAFLTTFVAILSYCISIYCVKIYDFKDFKSNFMYQLENNKTVLLEKK